LNSFALLFPVPSENRTIDFVVAPVASGRSSFVCIVVSLMMEEKAACISETPTRGRARSDKRRRTAYRTLEATFGMDAVRRRANRIGCGVGHYEMKLSK